VLTLLPQHLGELRLNVRSGEVHSSARGVISANEISRLYLELSQPFSIWPKEATADGITLLASRSPFDHVVEYLEGITAEPLPVEQWQRLDQHLLGIDDPIAAAFLPRYFISAVARAFDPGCYVRQVPVLIGPQERGKGELGSILFGASNWVEGVGSLDRDALMKCHTAWGVELAELDGVTRRADQEHLKAFITEKADTYRKPYDRSPDRHPRRFVFWGTSNRPPLRDSTGSTRFVCIPIPDQPLPQEWAR
jgi:predicted P-loop ATPase